MAGIQTPICYYIVRKYKTEEHSGIASTGGGIMTSYINEYSVYKTQNNTEPEWARAERLAYCESLMDARHEAGIMDSLRTFFDRIFH